MCRPLQQPTASLRAVEWRVAPLDLRLWRRVGAGATRLPVRRRHRRQGKVPRDRDQAPHCTHAGRRAGAVPTAARTRRALRRPVRAETDGLPRRLEWRLGSRARDAAITPPLRPSPSGHGAMPIPPMVSQRPLRALSVLSPSLGFVCVGLSLMRVVYQVCSSSVEEWRTNLGKQTSAHRPLVPPSHGSSRHRGHAIAIGCRKACACCSPASCLLLGRPPRGTPHSGGAEIAS